MLHTPHRGRRAGAILSAAALVAGMLGVLVGPADEAHGAVPVGSPGQVYARMSLAQRVGQLFMVGGPATGAGPATQAAISRYHVGSVMLTGRSTLSVGATRGVTSGLQSLTTRSATLGVPLFVGTDQEGGYVQVLQGSGFSRMPTALTQGTWPASTLRSAATTWGDQLHAAGVNVNLAPVMDTVPPGDNDNPPIGYYDREYGHDPSTVADHGDAFLQGMRAAGVDTTIKHFPGLGRVTANTDTASGVTDTITTRHDAYIAPFQSGVNAGTQFLMMSTAYYSRIDPAHPAAFSSTIIGGMVRGDLGFRGVVISDDLGNAQQVQAWTPGQRAIDFLGAGGDMVLTVNPDVIPAMVDAVLSRAESDAGFRAGVDASALRVLTAKANLGLIRPAFVPGDFTGSGRSDLAVFRPSAGTWYVQGVADARWGLQGDIPLAMDDNGDLVNDWAVFRPSTGTWYLRGIANVRWGQRGDIPVPGDYTGAGHSDLAVFRPSTGTWWVRGVETVRWGQQGDIPVPGDYNGDGVTDLAVFRPSTGTWWVRGIETVRWGQQGDIPIEQPAGLG